MLLTRTNVGKGTREGHTNTVWVGGVVLDVLVVELEHEGIKVALAMGFQEFGRKQEINKLGRYRTVCRGWGGGYCHPGSSSCRWFPIVYRKWVEAPVLHL